MTRRRQHNVPSVLKEVGTKRCSAPHDDTLPSSCLAAPPCGGLTITQMRASFSLGERRFTSGLAVNYRFDEGKEIPAQGPSPTRALARPKRRMMFAWSAPKISLHSTRIKMVSTQQEKQPTDAGQKDRAQMSALIGKNVLLTLGQPGNFFRVQVRALWGDYFRANVLVGPDIASVKVAHSYFLLADGSGNILSSNPEITKRY